MALEIYNSKHDFLPQGRLLNYWTSLPQSGTEVNGKPIPSLYGNLKSILIPTLMVCLLILLEIGLAYEMNDQGLDPLILISLSVFDFAIAIFPIFFLGKKKQLAKIRSQIFIFQTKQTICGTIETDNISEELKEKNKIKSIKYIINTAIIALAVWKFVNYYNVLGGDIFSEPIGRFTILTIIVGVGTHIYFTKDWFVYWFQFRPVLKNSLKKWRGGEAYKLHGGYAEKLLDYPVDYTPAGAGRQFIGEKVDTWDKQKDVIRTVEQANNCKTNFRVNRFEDQTRIYLVHSGLLIDAEINELFIAQRSDPAKEAVVALCKEIQLSRD